MGIITRNLDENNTLLEFMDNAETHGHEIEEIIIGYAEDVDEAFLDRLSERVRVRVVNVLHDPLLEEDLHRLDLRTEWLDYVVRNPVDRRSRLVPYGMLRNNVILRAILDGVEILTFVDTDVYPEVILQDGTIDSIDFFGMHEKTLLKEGVKVTTSDYSGYYIVPKIRFEGLRDYLIAVGKERAVSFVMDSEYQARCFDPGPERKPFVTDKVLGGNLVLDLSVFKQIVPFFSSMYRFDGKDYLTRGEDTVLGQALKKTPGIEAVDIDLKIRHDTYGDYPKIPDIYNDQAVRDRFFMASIGWIGRNPFMYWVVGDDVEQHYQRQYRLMQAVEKEMADHLSDWRFEWLSRAIKVSYGRLNVMIHQYTHFIENWGQIVKTLERRGIY